MSSKKEVIHTGIVKELRDAGIKVSILVKSGCASCEIKGACNMAEQSDKELDIDCSPAEYRVGQRVEIRLKSSQGMHALFLGYFLPFLILLATMIIASNLITNEGTVGLVSIGSLIPYYTILYFFKNRIKKKFSYVVRPLT